MSQYVKIMKDDELYHYGVPGMKWGKRKMASIQEARAKSLKVKGEKSTAKRKQKAAIKEQYNKIDDKAQFRDRLLYNNATRKKAAKYIVKNDMPYEDAMNKAKDDAIRNTVIFIAAYGALSIASSALRS